MSSRRFLIVILSLTLSWASSINSATAQPAALDKLVRVTYPVADLVIPIENFTAFKTDKEPAKSADEMARVLVKLLTDTVTKESWETHGGQGTIQYFPLGKALVVNQRRDVHDAIARVLGDLRALQDVQVSIEMRFITVAPKFAERVLGALNEAGQPVRALDIRKPAPVGRFTSLDEKQVFALLESMQGDRATNIMQAPKLTLFNGQQAGIVHTGLRCDLLPVVDADQKNVRVSLDFEFTAEKGRKAKHVARAAGTFTLPSHQTLVWHQGEFASQHLFVLMTPRVMVVKEEAVDRKDAGAEEQSAPEPKRIESPRAVPMPPDFPRRGSVPYQLMDPKERAIEHRLRQPINLKLNLK